MFLNEFREEIIPRLDRYSDQNERGMSDILDVRQAQQFTELHPEIYFSERNAELLQGWICSRGGCISVRNLEIAARELSKTGALETRPPNPPVPARKPNNGSDRGVVRVANTIFVRDSVRSEDRSKYADQPYESDVVRKKRDEQLRLAATRDRLERRKASQ
jgi:hypothetical protein